MKKWEKPELIELDIKKTAYGTKHTNRPDNEYIDNETDVKHTTYS